MKTQVQVTANLNNKIVQEVLETLVGNQVSVWIGVGPRNSFNTQVSVAGLLEQHPQIEDRFRVVVGNRIPTAGSYTYFHTIDVIEIANRGEENFKDGSQAVIRIKI